MCFEFEFETGFFESCKAPSWLSSKTGKHGIPLPGIMKRQTCLKNNNSYHCVAKGDILCFRSREGGTFCVLENHDTHAPAHIIALPDTDLLSVALLA